MIVACFPLHELRPTEFGASLQGSALASCIGWLGAVMLKPQNLPFTHCAYALLKCVSVVTSFFTWLTFSDTLTFWGEILHVWFTGIHLSPSSHCLDHYCPLHPEPYHQDLVLLVVHRNALPWDAFDCQSLSSPSPNSCKSREPPAQTTQAQDLEESGDRSGEAEIDLSWEGAGRVWITVGSLSREITYVRGDHCSPSEVLGECIIYLELGKSLMSDPLITIYCRGLKINSH